MKVTWAWKMLADVHKERNEVTCEKFGLVGLVGVSADSSGKERSH